LQSRWDKENAMKPLVFAVDNDELVLNVLKSAFSDSSIDVETAKSGAEAIAKFKVNPKRFAAVLLDYELRKDGAGINGDVLAKQLKAISPDTPIVMFSGEDSEFIIQSCREAGAEEFIIKGGDPNVAIDAVKATFMEEEDVTPAESDAVREERIARVLKLRGRSPEMSKVADLVARYSRYDEPVLILGESGVGKEAVARAVHENSGRKGKFVAINCGAIGRDLLESELFGHERGAFTGALTKKVGAFEYANNGTIFLDEIGDMPLELQVKILRALQEKTIQPVGGREIRVDFRVVAATHRDLEGLIAEKGFRQDLYYRLKYLTVNIPPLRERQEDIEPLVHFFIGQMQARTHQAKSVTDAAMRALKVNLWPGNVRDLEATVKSAFVRADDKIKPVHLELSKSSAECDDNQIISTLRGLSEILQYSDFMKLVESAERWLLGRALEVSGNRKAVAAALLGMGHSSMNYRRRALGLDSNN
jgi:two-component system nitrogen regulation response regulator GlnG